MTDPNAPALAPVPLDAAPPDTDDLHARLAEAERTINEQRDTIAHIERAQRIEALLRDAEAIDLDAARLLTEIAVQGMEQPDVESAVNELRARHPALFHPRARRALALAPTPDEPSSPIADAALEASRTGSRRDLLHYLRLRRRS